MLEGFDEFCDKYFIKAHEQGEAFAAWLNAETCWDGTSREVNANNQGA